MDIQELYELADREIRLGTFDRAIMERARAESGGVEAVAHQHYWRLRSEALIAESKKHPGLSEAAYLAEVRHRLDKEQGGRKLRANLVGWIWVLVCFGASCGSFVFYWAAWGAFRHGDSKQFGYGVAGTVCVALGVVAYIVTQRDAGQDPFNE